QPISLTKRKRNGRFLGKKAAGLKRSSKPPKTSKPNKKKHVPRLTASNAEKEKAAEKQKKKNFAEKKNRRTSKNRKELPRRHRRQHRR
ncbi:hypothetical protein, partial [Streptomyces kanasensis]|uniref:hypothetical protein n=1 Tax=Streptomyces kanasensis TaxID=936756 RepID=UPI0012FF94F4